MRNGVIGSLYIQIIIQFTPILPGLKCAICPMMQEQAFNMIYVKINVFMIEIIMFLSFDMDNC